MTGLENNIITFVSDTGDDKLLIGIGIVAFFRIVSLIYVIKDSNARSQNMGFQFLSIIIILALTPIFWLPLYFAIRPAGFKRDRTLWRDILELKAANCSNCWSLQSITNNCCTKCWEVMKTSCRECWERYNSLDEYCLYCGAPNIWD